MSSMTGQGPLVGPTGKVGNKVPKGYGVAQYKQFTPEQDQLFQQQFGYLGPDSYLSKLAQGGDEQLWSQIENPALRQFGELQGGLASRFSQGGGGRGALGSRKSSGFQNTSSAAASNFAQQLQSQRQSLTRQALSDLMGYSNQLLNQRPYQTQLYEKPQEESGWSKWAPLAGGLIGGAVGLAGGPFGAAAGYSAGSAIGSAFS